MMILMKRDSHHLDIRDINDVSLFMWQGYNATCISLPATLPSNQDSTLTSTDPIVVGMGKALV